MAVSSFQLFLNQARSAPEGLKIKVLQVIFDLLMVHSEALLFRAPELVRMHVCSSKIHAYRYYLTSVRDHCRVPAANPGSGRIRGGADRALHWHSEAHGERFDRRRASECTYLNLVAPLTALQALMCLVVAYVSPATRRNEELRQCLTYVLPAYCYASPANQKRMQSVRA